MSDLVPFEKYAVSQMDTNDLREVIQANVGDAAISERQLDRVKIPAGGSTTWTVPTLEGEIETKELVGVVVYSKLVRAYWQTNYDDGGGSDIPDCASPDSTIAYPPGEFVPPAAEQDGGGFACASCELSKFGSGKDGRGQACQQKRLLFILTEGDVLPFVVALAPTSLKAASDYMLRLTRGGKPYFTVQTKITLAKFTDPKPHARAEFTKAADLDADATASMRAYRDAIMPALTAFRPDAEGASA